MDIFDFLTLIGGLSLFLFGMRMTELRILPERASSLLLLRKRISSFRRSTGTSLSIFSEE